MYRILNYLIILLIISIFFILISSTKMIREYDLKIYDLTTLAFGIYKRDHLNQASNVVIVNIDNRSVNQIEQWPWSRIIYAQLIDNINELTPTTIGFNLHFSHKDKASPIVMRRFYQKYFDLNTTINNIPKELENNDRFLAQKLSESKSILSVRLFNSHKKTATHCRHLSYDILDLSKIDSLPHFSYLECNTPEFHQHNPNFGFSMIPVDPDGIVREIPLLKGYQEKVIPSFGLATLLSLNIHDYDPVRRVLKFFDKSIFLESHRKLLLPYSLSNSPIFSAIDVLRRDVPEEAFYGKIVIVGATVNNVNRYQQIYHTDNVCASIIHASYIESLLNDTFIVQSSFYKKLNMGLALLFSLFLYFLLRRRRYITMLLLTLLLFVVSIFYLLFAFEKGIYISVGYLWLPIIFICVIFLVAIIFSKNKKEKEALKKDLVRSLHSSATSMALVANTHDQETGEHLIRTKKYVKLLAVELYKKGLYPESITPHKIELISEAAPLHDIGKVGISDSILKKPGKLTIDEFEIMKTHSKLGADIITQSLAYYEHNPLLEIAHNIALYHHERWDGKGYPKGLKENEIPIEAQLMSIADVYDALISKRRYKEAFTYEKAESIIISERGKAFSPILVDIFIEQKENFKAISLEWHEEQMV